MQAEEGADAGTPAAVTHPMASMLRLAKSVMSAGALCGVTPRCGSFQAQGKYSRRQRPSCRLALVPHRPPWLTFGVLPRGHFLARQIDHAADALLQLLGRQGGGCGAGGGRRTAVGARVRQQFLPAGSPTGARTTTSLCPHCPPPERTGGGGVERGEHQAHQRKHHDDQAGREGGGRHVGCL